MNQQVFVVIGRLKSCPAGYNLIGVYSTEELAEECKAKEESSPSLHSGLRWDAVDVWNDELDAPCIE